MVVDVVQYLQSEEVDKPQVLDLGINHTAYEKGNETFV